jgi:hypothetical protein
MRIHARTTQTSTAPTELIDAMIGELIAEDDLDSIVLEVWEDAPEIIAEVENVVEMVAGTDEVVDFDGATPAFTAGVDSVIALVVGATSVLLSSSVALRVAAATSTVVDSGQAR